MQYGVPRSLSRLYTVYAFAAPMMNDILLNLTGRSNRTHDRPNAKSVRRKLAKIRPFVDKDITSIAANTDTNHTIPDTEPEPVAQDPQHSENNGHVSFTASRMRSERSRGTVASRRAHVISDGSQYWSATEEPSEPDSEGVSGDEHDTHVRQSEGYEPPWPMKNRNSKHSLSALFTICTHNRTLSDDKIPFPDQSQPPGMYSHCFFTILLSN